MQVSSHDNNNFNLLLERCVFPQEYYELDLAHFLSTPGLAWRAAFKNINVKLYLLTDIGMLLMIKKILEEEYVTLFTDMQKLTGNT